MYTTQQPPPNTLPGHLGENRYLRPTPNTTLIHFVIGLLYSTGAVVMLTAGLAGAWLAAGFDYATRLVSAAAVLSNSSAGKLPPNVTPAVTIPGSWPPILFGLFVGFVVGVILALPLFALAQTLGIHLRIEENTRQTKELLYYFVADKWSDLQ